MIKSLATAPAYAAPGSGAGGEIVIDDFTTPHLDQGAGRYAMSYGGPFQERYMGCHALLPDPCTRFNLIDVGNPGLFRTAYPFGIAALSFNYWSTDDRQVGVVDCEHIAIRDIQSVTPGTWLYYLNIFGPGVGGGLQAQILGNMVGTDLVWNIPPGLLDVPNQVLEFNLGRGLGPFSLTAYGPIIAY
ncbi:MAG: hypothetical protein GY713_12390 [Actinomycetia bacterium]|nr:hypothetical protein [Actinomycetes bacterium]